MRGGPLFPNRRKAISFAGGILTLTALSFALHWRAPRGYEGARVLADSALAVAWVGDIESLGHLTVVDGDSAADFNRVGRQRVYAESLDTTRLVRQAQDTASARGDDPARRLAARVAAYVLDKKRGRKGIGDDRALWYRVRGERALVSAHMTTGTLIEWRFCGGEALAYDLVQLRYCGPGGAAADMYAVRLASGWRLRIAAR